MNENLICDDAGDGVAVLTLKRAPVNALNPAFLDAIEAQLVVLESDRDVRALVISSALTVFSGGLDLKEAQDLPEVGQTAIVDGLNRTFSRLYGMPKPVVAAVNGAAIAGGLFFVLAADYSVSAAGAKFGLTEVRVGVSFPVAPLQIARAALAPAAFRQLLLGGRNVGSEVAVKMGIVDEVVSADDLMQRSLAVARDYATIPPLAYANVKAQMREGALNTMAEAVARNSDPARGGWFTDETRNAMAAMLAGAGRRTQ